MTCHSGWWARGGIYCCKALISFNGKEHYLLWWNWQWLCKFVSFANPLIFYLQDFFFPILVIGVSDIELFLLLYYIHYCSFCQHLDASLKYNSFNPALHLILHAEELFLLKILNVVRLPMSDHKHSG